MKTIQTIKNVKYNYQIQKSTNLPHGLEALDETECYDDPAEAIASNQIKAKSAKIINAVSQAQYFVAIYLKI